MRRGAGRLQERTIKQYLKKFTWTQVVAHKHAEELQEEIEKLAEGAGRGSKRYISTYQTALKALCNKYEPTKKDEYTKLAKTWNSTGPPRELQIKLMDKHSEHAVQEFAESMYRLFGMRVFVLGTYKGRDGQPSVMRYVCG